MNFSQRKSTAKWVLFFLLIYCIGITACCSLFPSNRTVALLSPFTILTAYLEQWAPELPEIVIVSRSLVWSIAVIPLIGWLLLLKPFRFGKQLIIAPHCIMLACNLLITASHFITGLGVKSGAYISLSLHLSAVNLLFSVAVLIAVSIWQPK